MVREKISAWRILRPESDVYVLIENDLVVSMCNYEGRADVDYEEVTAVNSEKVKQLYNSSDVTPLYEIEEDQRFKIFNVPEIEWSVKCEGENKYLHFGIAGIEPKQACVSLYTESIILSEEEMTDAKELIMNHFLHLANKESEK